jgi:leucyl aminopeptidase (aminopeptidase T)
MSWKCSVLVPTLAAAACALVATTSPAGTASGGAADNEALAKKLVNDCAGIREGDFVHVEGGTRDIELLENIAANVRKLGAFPLLTISSDRLTRRMYDDVPARYDGQAPEPWLKLAEEIDAVISVEWSETPGLLAHVSPERQNARAKANQPVGDIMLRRGVRSVSLGNDMYPTAARAEMWGVPQETLASVFWAGVNTDYRQLEATGKAISDLFAAGREVRITNANGTDFKVRIEGRKVFCSDGVISEADRAKGGPACQVWLPAGEVYLTAVPGTAEGTIIADRQFYQGKPIEGLTLTYKAGKLTSMTAKSGIEALKTRYDAAPAGKDEFAYLDVGINPAVKIPPGSRMVAWMPAGMVTVGTGGNEWAGGDNHCPYGLSTFVPGSTLTIDGKTLVDKGKLITPTAPASMGF